MTASLKTRLNGRTIAVILHVCAFLAGAAFPFMAITVYTKTKTAFFWGIFFLIAVAYVLALGSGPNFSDLKGKYDRNNIMQYLKEVSSVNRLSAEFLLGMCAVSLVYGICNAAKLKQDVLYMFVFLLLAVIGLGIGILVYKNAP